MIRRTCLECSVCAALLSCAVGMAGTGPTPPSVTRGCGLIALEHPDTPACVGEPLALAITIKNNTGKPLKVLDWEHFDLELVTADEVLQLPRHHRREAAIWT